MDDQAAHYTVLARRFRPQSFDEVVGQEHVAQALRNAIHSGRVAHAYLFTGARGVGKTSTARILAKSLNCPHAVDGNPCNECEVCLGIAAGNDVDVLEIDGASNRGIDDIRSLRANVNVKSMRTKFKIYIIDEVHMLTKEAFNALLKTLEEPPPSVKFVFCTTEPNKLPDTILSRCQRFDFGTIQTSRIGDRLLQIAEAEGKQVDQDAIELIARRAAGSMRDSQSLFDQLLAFGSEHLTADDVHRLLGTASDDRLLGLVEALVARDRAGALKQLATALDDGIQLGELVDQLLNYFRDLMVVAADASGVELLGVSESNRQQVTDQAGRWGLQTIVAAMEILSEARNRMQRVTFGRALAELALVRITLLEDLTDLNTLIQQIAANGAAAPRIAPPPQSTTPAGPPASVSRRDRGNEPEKKTAEPPPVTPQTPDKPPESLPTVEFRAENAKAIWAQVVRQIDDKIRGHIRNAQDIAISGPNHLSVVFPRRYHFNKTYCEQPEVTAQLATLAGKVTGTNVVVTFRIDEGDTPDEPQSIARPAPNARNRRPLEPGNDPLVNEAINAFGGKIAKVETLTNTPSRKE